MTENRNVEILQEAYLLWNNSKAESVSHWLNLFDDNFELYSLADGSEGMEFTKKCGCKNDLECYFEGLSKDWEMIHYTADEFIAQHDRVVMVGSCGWKHKKTGKIVDTPKVDIIRMRNGKIIDFREFYDTAKAISATT